MKKDPKKLWAEEELKKKIQEDSEISADSPYADDRGEDNQESDLKDAWKKLQSIARIKFPEKYAAKFQLKPRQRLTAVAACLGWTKADIAKASGFTRTTISRWLDDPAVQEFTEAFQNFQGSNNGKSLIEREVYASILAMKELRDDSRTPAAVRKDIAKFFLEMQFGKPKESVEHKGVDIKSLTEQINQLRNVNEDEDPLKLPERKTIN